MTWYRPRRDTAVFAAALVCAVAVLSGVAVGHKIGTRHHLQGKGGVNAQQPRQRQRNHLIASAGASSSSSSSSFSFSVVSSFINISSDGINSSDAFDYFQHVPDFSAGAGAEPVESVETLALTAKHPGGFFRLSGDNNGSRAVGEFVLRKINCLRALNSPPCGEDGTLSLSLSLQHESVACSDQRVTPPLHAHTPHAHQRRSLRLSFSSV